jgi:hypothetical protein
MKIRIQDNSIRFRLSLREVELFAADGCVRRRTQVVGPNGLGPVFEYRLEHDADAAESVVLIEGADVTVRLSSADRDTLLIPAEEGVYLRREWTAPGGELHRFMAFVEKDRPGSTCIKPEAWIYDAPPGGPLETRPIPPRKPA